MKTKYLDDFNINEVCEVLKRGGVVAFPTDTVFGLACIYDNKEAIERIKKVKGRDANKPLPMMCNGLKMIQEVAITDNRIERVIDKFTPGPLTIIFNKKDNIEDYITNGFKTIGIRVPNNQEILKVIDTLKKPLLVTSCNISGQPSIKKATEIKEIFDGLLDLIILKDAESEIASTIIDISNNELKMLRDGIIKEEELKEVYDER